MINFGVMKEGERDPHAPDPQGFIPFIHNYCDRWCEKCRFARQCRVGYLEVDDISEANEEAATEKVEDYKARLKQMLDMVEEEHEDSEDADGEPSFDPGAMMLTEEETADHERKEKAAREEVERHPLTVMGQSYMDLVDEWLDKVAPLLKSKGIDVKLRPELRGVALSADMLLLNEAVEEIVWFHTMLHVKTHRAIHGKLQDPDFMENIGIDPLQSDENGTAKLVLHIVDRCQDAWITITGILPELAADILPMQELLSRHGAAMRKEFPDAVKFIRPGFDAPVR